MNNRLLKNVLVVDDEKHIATETNSILNKNGFNSNYVLNGDDALKYLQDSTIDIILLDLKLDEKWDGRSLLKEIKKEFPTVMICLFTEITKKRIIDECINLGAFQYFSKPLDIELFKNALRN